MRTLAEAWKWYQATRDQLWRMRRMADRHWDELAWEGSLGRDEALRSLVKTEVSGEANLGLVHLDDLAILVLFSVFEAQVRDHVTHQVQEEAKALRHPALQHAAEETRQRIEEGSFFRVLEPYKKPLGPDLIEQVNQVRRYRNWVAHGRRKEHPIRLVPSEVFRPLQVCLDQLGIVEEGRTS